MEKIKIFYKPFILAFLIAFLIINWSSVSWVFNYQAVLRYTSDFFQKDESQNQVVKITNKFEEVKKENSIEISKIGITAPLVVNKSLSDSAVYKSLDTGVVYYPSSVLPGEIGQTIILGHSAPENWPKIKYDWVFSRLNELVEGDKIIIYYNNKEFTYSVIKKIFLNKGQDIPQNNLTNSKNIVVLVSCWPPGKDLHRIVVEAKIK